MHKITFILLVVFPLVSYCQFNDSLKFEFKNEMYFINSYDIYKNNNGKYTNQATFPLPNIEMLTHYRPDIVKNFGYDSQNYRLFDMIEVIESYISAYTISGNKIWVGFSFYEGEGCEGYGGIGFYDVQNSGIGILRHPALVDCSIDEMKILDSSIYIKTICNYELSSTLCNGIVVLDTNTLDVYSLKPNGPSLIQHKDGGINVSDIYNRPISELIIDTTLLKNKTKDYVESVKNKILNAGFENYMISKYKNELKSYDDLKENSDFILNDTVIIDLNNTNYQLKLNKSYPLIYIEGLRHSLSEHFWAIKLNLPNYRGREFYITAGKEIQNYLDMGKEIIAQTSKYYTRIKLINFDFIDFEDPQNRFDKLIKRVVLLVQFKELLNTN